MALSVELYKALIGAVNIQRIVAAPITMDFLIPKIENGAQVPSADRSARLGQIFNLPKKESSSFSS